MISAQVTTSLKVLVCKALSKKPALILDKTVRKSRLVQSLAGAKRRARRRAGRRNILMTNLYETHRRFANRYEKRACLFFAVTLLAAILVWIA